MGMAYKVIIQPKAFKALEKINDPAYSAIKAAVNDLAENPRPQGYIKLKGREGYRIRVGEYRILYTVTDAILQVDVINLGHRKDIYD